MGLRERFGELWNTISQYSTVLERDREAWIGEFLDAVCAERGHNFGKLTTKPLEEQRGPYDAKMKFEHTHCADCMEKKDEP